MEKLARAFRVVLGGGLVAGGVVLVGPLAAMVTQGWFRGDRTAVGDVSAAAPAADVAPEIAAQPPASWLVPESELPPPVELNRDYVPPRPADRLPPAVSGLTANGIPDMNGTYRSTLAVPPPPLLDGQPLDGADQSRAPAMGATAGFAGTFGAARLAGAAPVTPATYVVGDGDDLTTIATRVYGHPGAAAAVWDANRDILSDPGLLPIGASLRLPPAWAVGGPSAAAAGRAIEPAAAGVFPGGTGSTRRETAIESQGWLMAPAGSGGGANSAAGPALRGGIASGGTVRLGPGETLSSLAERLYGDRNAARRIWEVNRDRLRSPDLAVQGMELRLP